MKVGKEGVEPSRLAARDSKSRLSANSSTSPNKVIIEEGQRAVNARDIILRRLVEKRNMGRVINPDSVGKERKQLTRAVVIALRELTQQGKPSSEARDLAAIIALSLEAIAETVERTVVPWEKRDYWLKADRFRLDWAWAERIAGEMRRAVLEDDWAAIATLSAKVAEKLSGEKIPQRHRLGRFWEGAWEKLQAE